MTDADLLRKYNDDIWKELEIVYASPSWKFLQIVYKTLNFIMPKDQFKRKIGKKQKMPVENITDIKILQKYNKKLTQELGTIYASAGWKMFKKFKRSEK